MQTTRLRPPALAKHSQDGSFLALVDISGLRRKENLGGLMTGWYVGQDKVLKYDHDVQSWKR